jgi:hypothetical protein
LGNAHHPRTSDATTPTRNGRTTLLFEFATVLSSYRVEMLKKQQKNNAELYARAFGPVKTL